VGAVVGHRRVRLRLEDVAVADGFFGRRFDDRRTALGASSTDQQMSLRSRWSSSTRSRIA